MTTVTTDFIQEFKKFTDRFILKQSLYTSRYHEIVLLFDTLLSRDIAAKTIKPEYLTLETSNNLKNEFKKIISLNHKSIIRGYEFYQENNSVFYTVDYVESVFNQENTDKYINDILSAFSYLHNQNMIHNDIKENNFLFSGDSCFLIDFSISRKGTDFEIEEEVLFLARYLIQWVNKIFNINLLDNPKKGKKYFIEEDFKLILSIIKGKKKRLIF